MKAVLKDLEESKSEKSDDEESKDEPREADRQQFIYTRVQQMSDLDYK